MSQRILVVDDELDIVKSLVFRLKKHGYEVVTAEDGEQALKQLKSGSYDLLCLDLRLPRIDGHEVLRQMKADERLKKLPVLVLTAESDPKAIKKVELLKPDRLFRKPYESEVLLAAVKELLGKSAC